ncbi:hypothetical protein FB567DRAFT_531122 [Paraphoma chrysanthemicola]|uniref:F-box domain-containing protein n=1 Tax=Paraphoma chrysanthemicola TaxID=798071 RepID=A0A8K0R142_9PLEO|nr:hypothetical protein FB567DRAFT_531122 [Paraphoma chrysanthemicola]
MSKTSGAELTAEGPLTGRDTSAKDMTTLLPNELLLMLIHLFEHDAATLAQLSCVSRRLSFIAREPLYKRIKVPNSKLGMQRLLRALLANRRLADLTTSLDLVGYLKNTNEGPWASQFPDVEGLMTYHYSLAYLNTFFRNFEHRISMHHMVSQLMRRSTSAYCAILFTLFPNLEIVHFALYQDQANFCQAPLRAMYKIKETVHTLGPLDRLSSSLDKLRQLHIPAANVELLCFFGLRQLDNLRLDFSQQFEDSAPLNGLLYRHRQLPELSVQTINITCGYQEADPEWTEFSEVREVLTRIQHENGAQDGLAALKSVNIIVKDLPHYEGHHTVEMDTLISQLEPVFGVVRELKIESPQLSENVYFHPSLPNTSGDREVLIMVRHFKNLQRLEIFQAAIIPRSLRFQPHPEPDLTITFPSSMKQLVVTHCRR